MGYSLTIGKALIDTRDFDYDKQAVMPCEGDPAEIHQDEWEATGMPGPVRLPSYTAWGEALEALSKFKALWSDLETDCRVLGVEADLGRWIPVRYYEDYLDGVEQEALKAPKRCAADAARALWFVRWSREALRRYGNLAAFETPGEWAVKGAPPDEPEPPESHPGTLRDADGIDKVAENLVDLWDVLVSIHEELREGNRLKRVELQILLGPDIRVNFADLLRDAQLDGTPRPVEEGRSDG